MYFYFLYFYPWENDFLSMPIKSELYAHEIAIAPQCNPNRTRMYFTFPYTSEFQQEEKGKDFGVRGNHLLSCFYFFSL